MGGVGGAGGPRFLTLYVTAALRVGACPVLLPPGADPDGVRSVLSVLDGLVITGGPDVDPGRYGAEAHPRTGAARAQRDEWELGLCQAALAQGLPLLAYLSGAAGAQRGTRWHPASASARGGRPRGARTRARSDGHHEGFLATWVRRSPQVLGLESVVLCHHHQAIDRLGTDLRAAGFAGDGTIEAVEVAGQEFAWGVQWHPEDGPDDDRVFAALVDVAMRHRRQTADDRVADAAR